MIAPVRLYLTALVTKRSVRQNFKDNSIKGMIDCIQTLNDILLKNRTKFIAGNRPTIADFLIYHDLTNTQYFDLDYEKFSEVKRLFEEIYKIPQVKAITHEWYQTAKKIK